MREIIVRIAFLAGLTGLFWWGYETMPFWLRGWLAEFPILAPTLAVFAILSLASAVHERLKQKHDA